MANTTWNPSDISAGITLSNGNLTATRSTGNGGCRSVDKQIGGKFYWEVTATTFLTSTSSIGVMSPVSAFVSLSTQASALSSGVNQAGSVCVDGVSAGVSLGTVASGAVVCIAYDITNRLIWYRLGAAGNWNNNVANNPATGVGGVSTTLGVGIPVYASIYLGQSTETITANFGGSAFTGAVPAGFTSGFTSGVTSPTNAIATQSALEQFFATNPPAQVTQVTIEQWATTATVSGQAMVTQVALEQWVPAPKLTVDLAGNLGGVSSYGRLSYGSKTYSRINAFTPIFGADLDVHVSLIDLRGDFASQIALGGSLSLDLSLTALEGSFGFSVVYGASSFISGPLWADTEPSPPPLWAESEPCPPPPWMTSPPCESVVWSKTRLCNG